MFGATDAYQLLKLPLLVSHYVEHLEQNPDISFLKFLKMHYSGEITIDADYQEEMQLPFKTHDTDCCLTGVTEVPACIEIGTKITENPVKKHHPANDNIPSSWYLFSVFQPPKV